MEFFSRFRIPVMEGDHSHIGIIFPERGQKFDGRPAFRSIEKNRYFLFGQEGIRNE